jgi:selenocysteine lyase/cysteine desulfurase
LSFKPLFSKSLSADPERLHMAAHSHHLWPDASFDGQVECWQDAARLADRKWDRIMGAVWPEAQRQVASELGTGMADSIVFAPNTHQLLVSLFAAVPAPRPVRVLTSDSEFHSARRQFLRWEENGEAEVERVAAEPFDSFSSRFLERAKAGGHDLIFVSQVLFGSGRLFDQVEALAALSRPGGPWVAIDGYHAFMAIESPFGPAAARSAFYLGGGYKYAMAGRGLRLPSCAARFRRAPADHRLVRRVRGFEASARYGRLPPRRDALHRRDLRFSGALPVQRGSPDAR